MESLNYTTNAGVAELVDAHDSKSCIREDVRVRVPPPAHKMISPKILALGKFNVSDLIVTRSESNRKIDPVLENKIDAIWKVTLEKAEQNKKVCYNGTQYRLNSLTQKDGALFLDLGTTEFKTLAGLTAQPEYFNLPEDFYIKWCFNRSTVKTADDKYVMVELTGKSMNTSDSDFIGGLMEKPMEMNTGADIFKSMQIELKEEAGIEDDDIREIYLRAIYLGVKTGAAFYFETLLNISSAELISRFEKENSDQDIKRLRFFSREEYISAIHNHPSKIKGFVADLVNI